MWNHFSSTCIWSAMLTKNPSEFPVNSCSRVPDNNQHTLTFVLHSMLALNKLFSGIMLVHLPILCARLILARQFWGPSVVLLSDQRTALPSLLLSFLFYPISICVLYCFSLTIPTSILPFLWHDFLSLFSTGGRPFLVRRKIFHQVFLAPWGSCPLTAIPIIIPIKAIRSWSSSSLSFFFFERDGVGLVSMVDFPDWQLYAKKRCHFSPSFDWHAVRFEYSIYIEIKLVFFWL